MNLEVQTKEAIIKVAASRKNLSPVVLVECNSREGNVESAN